LFKSDAKVQWANNVSVSIVSADVTKCHQRVKCCKKGAKWMLQWRKKPSLKLFRTKIYYCLVGLNQLIMG